MSGISDLDNYVRGQTSNVGATPANTQTASTNALRRRVFTFQKPGLATTGDDASASTDCAETPVFVNLTGGTITVVAISYACGNTGITGSDTVQSTMTINKRDAAGANSKSVATLATTATGGTGTMTVGQVSPFTLTTTVADRTVVAGAALCYARTHTSTGTVIAGGVITIQYVEN